MIAVRDNELSAASMAQSPRRVKLTAFAISGAIASLAGFLYGGLLINFSNNPGLDVRPGESLSLVVTAVFGGITSVTGADARFAVDHRHPAAARRGLRAVLVGVRRGR